jgi:large subunit ribosomal protein L10
MASPDKVAAVAELKDKFSNSAGAVLTEYRGLTVKALKDLRRSLGENATYAVSKNTLTTIAAREAGVEGLDEHLVGPTAITFVEGDPVVAAKGLRDFARTNPLLVIKGGVLEGKFLNPDEVRRLADLESREVLLAKVAGGMQGVLQQAISLVSAPLSQMARLAAALEQAAQENPSIIAGAGTPAAVDQEPSSVESSTEDTAAPAVTETAPAAEDTNTVAADAAEEN